MTQYSYGVSITDGSFSSNLGSTFEGSTGSITGTFSADGKSCSGKYTYKKSPCDDISVNWTATVGDSVVGDEVNITDSNFLSALIEQGVDTDEDGLISQNEAKAIDTLDVSSQNISDLTGIEAFVNLTELQCNNNKLSSLDLSINVMLENLRCYSNELTALDVSKNPELTYLDCGLNQIGVLDVSKNTLLEDLLCDNNEITNLDVSKNTLLNHLYCYANLLTSLEVSKNSVLKRLWCNNNELGSLDVSANKYLSSLLCRNTGLNDLSVEQNPVLVDLRCSGNKLTLLDLSKNYFLAYLDCSTNLLTNLDVTINTDLTNLICDENLLTTLDISKNTAIGTKDYAWSDDLDISGMPTLTCVSVWVMPFPPDSLEVIMDGSPNVVFTTEACSGVGVEEDIQYELSVYPNPVNGITTLQLEVPAEYSIEIVSMNGQVVMQRQFSGSSYELDLSSIPKGIYFLTIGSGEFVTTKKIVKL